MITEDLVSKLEADAADAAARLYELEAEVQGLQRRLDEAEATDRHEWQKAWNAAAEQGVEPRKRPALEPRHVEAVRARERSLPRLIAEAKLEDAKARKALWESKEVAEYARVRDRVNYLQGNIDSLRAELRENQLELDSLQGAGSLERQQKFQASREVSLAEQQLARPA